MPEPFYFTDRLTFFWDDTSIEYIMDDFGYIVPIPGNKQEFNYYLSGV